MILLFIATIGSEAKFDEGNGKDSEELRDEVGEETAIVVEEKLKSLKSEEVSFFHRSL